MTAVSFSSLLDSWDRQQAAYIAEREARFNAQLDVLALAAGQDFHVVDLACGPGSLSLRILQRFPQARVTAIDLDPLLLAGAPDKVLAYCAIDAFTHLFEAYLSKTAGAMTRDMSLSEIGRASCRERV